MRSEGAPSSSIPSIPWRPFAVAWLIWLGGYALLLAADLVVRSVLAVETGLSELPVAVTATLVASTACGYFLAATGRWPMYRRLLALAVQIPPAYLAAVMLGYSYLCAVEAACP